jgi:LmbE family N-acetylglucosaminyl deacetylase
LFFLDYYNTFGYLYAQFRFLNNMILSYFRFLFLLLAAGVTTISQAQKPVKPSAADIHQAIKKLNVLGTVLYVAAHPDDENQNCISYYANHKLCNVTYLSLTRGDGGQNLIGPELRELLGVLRTEELLAARAIDGGKQMFSRANDFGFSKNPEETLRIWNKEAVLSDVVWAIRKVQPDVIINRFYHDKKYDTHGHHTSSAILSVEAFDLAGRADVYPEQLKYVQPWQPRRVFFNTSWFFFGSQEKFNQMDKSNLFGIDQGTFLPLKGKSNSEVAAEARSNHRCQGFGAMSSRGESLGWFDFVKGDKPPLKGDLLDGINTTWTRVPGGEKIGKLMTKIDQEYRSDNPSASVPKLLKALQMVKSLPEGHWRTIKIAELEQVIKNCLGLYVESVATEPGAAPGDVVKVQVEIINRSTVPVVLNKMSIAPALYDTLANQPLENNRIWKFEKNVRLPLNTAFTAPYWLQKPASIGMYTVDNQLLRGLPETPHDFKVRWEVSISGLPFVYETDVAYKIEESALGEIWRPFEVLPPAFVEFDQPSYLFNTDERHITVRVKAGRIGATGKVQISAPAGWTVTPLNGDLFSFQQLGEEKDFTFNIRHEGPNAPNDVELEARAILDDRTFSQRLVTIRYDHIPQQSVLLPAKARAVRADVQTTAKNIGYYMGAGDDVPAALRQMGCTVTMLEDKDMTPENLARYDAIVIGIRAYNTKTALAFHQPKLFEYVQNGGTLLTQYMNNYDWVVAPNKVAPLSVKIGRARVTDENAEMRLLNPTHPALSKPNKIQPEDFNGWVQERGLYFPTEWDKGFTPLLSCNDPNEKALDGALLVAPYGKGHFVYTGLSFFRQFPAGVPGAYRLFANLISL